MTEPSPAADAALGPADVAAAAPAGEATRASADATDPAATDAATPTATDETASAPADVTALDAAEPKPADESPAVAVAEAEPTSYPPDPAGTRPKVPAMGLGSDSGTTVPLGRQLGGTFRTAAGAGSPAAVLPDVFTGADAGPGAAAESPHAPRFQFILGALLALGLSATAITAYTLSSGRDPLPTDWSAWHPTATGIGAATQIANHVAGEYRQAGTGELLAVKGGALTLDGLPVTIALKTGVAATGGVSVLDGNSISYKMCGLGTGCAITGKASTQRLMLVRREALELALYTFKYVGGADQVVVFLPPVVRPPVPNATGAAAKKPTTDPADAVFFRASDLANELGNPLTSTLTAQTPSVDTIDKAPDTPAVQQLTSPSFYKFSYVQTTQDASLFLVLQPLAVGN